MDLGRVAGDKWRRMSADERQPFRKLADQAKRDHSLMLEELSAGRARIEDYMGPPALAQGQTGTESPPVAAE